MMKMSKKKEHEKVVPMRRWPGVVNKVRKVHTGGLMRGEGEDDRPCVRVAHEKMSEFEVEDCVHAKGQPGMGYEALAR